MKRTVQAPQEEPEQRRFELPSEGEHLFQVVDKWTDKNDDNVVITKLEVAQGEELGRTLLHRVNLDSEWKGFFLTRLFLKSIKEEYKGEITIDDDRWIGRCFYATVIHNEAQNGKIYANIDIFEPEKEVEINEELIKEQPESKTQSEEVAWDEE